MLKFDIVIGNPPYQNEKNSTLYDKFMLHSREVSEEILMITKGAWTKGIGRGLSGAFIDEMNSPKTRFLIHYSDAELFGNGIFIAGGVTVIFWNNGNSLDNGFQKTFSIDGELVYEGEKLVCDGKIFSVLEEKELCRKSLLYMEEKSLVSLSEAFSPSTLFGIAYNYSDYREIPDDEYNTKCFIAINRVRKAVYVKDSAIKNPELAKLRKVFLSKTSNAGIFGGIILRKPFIDTGATAGTYIPIGIEDGKEKDLNWCLNLCKFLLTKTANALALLSLSSQNVYGKSFKYVPYLDFNSEAFTKMSVDDLDKWIQKELGLSESEVSWIESRVKYRIDDLESGLIYSKNFAEDYCS